MASSDEFADCNQLNTLPSPQPSLSFHIGEAAVAFKVPVGTSKIMSSYSTSPRLKL